MGRIMVNANLTLDGVVQDPSGDEGTPQGGWFARMSDADRAAWAQIETDEALATDAILLGRHSDAWFASRWQERSGVWADRLNGLPKYVVSSSITEARWSNGTVLRGEVLEEVTSLKDRVHGKIAIFGSGTLVRKLIAHDLVDELHLMVHPFVLGSGDRLFGATPERRSLRLLAARAVGSEVVNVRYAVVR